MLVYIFKCLWKCLISDCFFFVFFYVVMYEFYLFHFLKIFSLWYKYNLISYCIFFFFFFFFFFCNLSLLLFLFSYWCCISVVLCNECFISNFQHFFFFFFFFFFFSESFFIWAYNFEAFLKTLTFMVFSISLEINKIKQIIFYEIVFISITIHI